ncbi:MAG: 2-(1,2-epoxy-1,2-dihydrophenyl)acetyl-CoA isomerase [Alphaproteobacteria bacterium]|nr:2-(1,2-epoxy-1,2-dihydrophenyl)acetyl-CoA isomerase [Alphaproteobacteria bacterium]
MTYQTIKLEIESGVALLTLNRPDVLNSYSGAMLGELKQAVESLPGLGARALLITGSGRAFCAGADLSGEMPKDAAGNLDLGKALDESYHPFIQALRALPMPSIAAVNGAAAGAGASLALTCDLAIAGRSAYFLQAFCNIGLVPDAGSTYFLPRAAGSARAMGLAMLGERLPAEKAEAWGLIWKCVDDDKLMAEARAIAAKLAAGPTKGLALIKRALQASPGNDLAAQLALERDSQRQAGRSRDFVEGVAAFFQKRPPKFTGQ